MRMLSLTRLVLCWLRSFSSFSRRCAAFLSSASTHASSRAPSPGVSPAIVISSMYSTVFVVFFTSSTAVRSTSALSALFWPEMNPIRLTRVNPW